MSTSHSKPIADLLLGISESHVRKHVDALASIGPRSVDDPAAIRRTLDYLSSALHDCGYAVQEEPFGDPHQVNLLATLGGATLPDSVLELGAHYDTVVGSPGADDNASGVAGLLKIARVLSGAQCERSIRFCLFGAEESGRRGSLGHVARIRRQSDETVEGIVVYEMIGFRKCQPHSQRTPVRIPLVIWPPRTADFIAAVANYRSRSLTYQFEQAAECYVPELRVYGVKWLGGFLKDAARSDHLPYWQAGLKGIMVTDTANFRNPHYHQMSDLPDTLDYPFLVGVTRATAAMLLEWAGLRPD